MKKTILALSVVALLGLSITACKKNTQRVMETQPTEGTALLKVIHAMPFAKNPGIQVKVNNDRVSNLITYSTPYPGGGLNTGGSSNPDYMSFKPGATSIALSIPFAGLATDSVAAFSGTATLAADVRYSAYITDTAANATMVVVQDNIALPDSGFSTFKFVNLIPNLPAVDLYFGTTLVASNIPYKGVSPTFQLVAPSAFAWGIRPAGGSPTIAAIGTYATGTVPNQRVMTVYSRGYSGLTGTDIRRPMISLLYNR